MTAKEFVAAFYLEKEHMLNEYCGTTPRIPQYPDLARLKIQALDLTEAQFTGLREVVDTVLTDAFYKTLLCLDGAANIGGMQETFRLSDESGNELTGGDIEGFAWEYFHSNEEGK